MNIDTEELLRKMRLEVEKLREENDTLRKRCGNLMKPQPGKSPTKKQCAMPSIARKRSRKRMKTGPKNFAKLLATIDSILLSPRYGYSKNKVKEVNRYIMEKFFGERGTFDSEKLKEYVQEYLDPSRDKVFDKVYEIIDAY